LIGDPQRLQRVVPGRHPGLHVAKAAAPGADVAEDHEGRGAALPAFADIGAVRLLADGVQVVLLDRLAETPIGRAARCRHLQPGRLALAEGPRRFPFLGAAGTGPGPRYVESRGCAGHEANGTGRRPPARAPVPSTRQLSSARLRWTGSRP